MWKAKTSKELAILETKLFKEFFVLNFFITAKYLEKGFNCVEAIHQVIHNEASAEI